MTHRWNLVEESREFSREFVRGPIEGFGPKFVSGGETRGRVGRGTPVSAEITGIHHRYTGYSRVVSLD